MRVNMDVSAVSRGTLGLDSCRCRAVVRLVTGRPNVCLGTGALPYETPPENVLRLREYASTL